MELFPGELNRFVSRRYVGSVQRSLPTRIPAHRRWERLLAQRWAGLLGGVHSDVVLLATVEEARRAAVQLAFSTGATALISQPTTLEWPWALIAAGAQYVDIGRRLDDTQPAGLPQALALARAAAAHPDATWIAESPSWFGSDDAAMDPGAIAVIVDATRSDQCLPRTLPAGRQLVTLLALRDPQAPTIPLAVALVHRGSEARRLTGSFGPAALPALVAEHALDLMDGLLRDPAWAESHLPVLAAREARWRALLGDVPGVQLYPRAGVEIAALCRAGDAEACLQRVVAEFPDATAWQHSAMRGLLTAPLWPASP